MSLWPEELRSVRGAGMLTIEALALELFGVTANDPNCPKCLQRWAFLSLCRLHCEGDEHNSALLDAAIAKAAAEFKSEAN